MRVNLLRKSELRYQGAVTKRFMVVAPLLTIGLTLVIIIPIYLMNMASSKSQYNQLTEEVARLQKRADIVLEHEKQIKASRDILNRLDQWKNQNMDVAAMLQRMQRLTPETIQFLNLAYSVLPEQPDANPSQNWLVTLQLTGHVTAAVPEEVVLRYLNRLSQDKSLSAFFDNMNLVSYTRLASTNHVELADFHITGKGKLALN
ncbi:MAG: hypothetical protein EOL87_04800 [Spartobacteria bacterium]|nr:hypothetical protein [Spartobacteria bacterium]